nr:phage major capsid protein [Sphingomonas sp. Y57]
MTKHTKIFAQPRQPAIIMPADLRRKDAPDLDKVLADHIGVVTKALSDLKSTDKTTEEKLAEHHEMIFELSQKMAQRSRGMGNWGAGDNLATWGKIFSKEKGADITAMRSNDRVSLEFKASLTSATTDAAGSAGDLIVPDREAVLGMPRRRMTIRNLLRTVPVSSGSVEYPKQVARNLNPGTVAEGAEKPQSDLQWGLKTAPIRTIAHWMKASRQILEDVPQLEGMIDLELRYGLTLQEEAQLLYGDNTGQNLHGMTLQATAYDSPIDVVDVNHIDVIGGAILQVSLTDVPPDGIVMHPADWWRMRLLKDANGKYILGDPMSVVPPSLFGLPVIATQAMQASKFLVGAFGEQTLYDRWEARVELGFVNDDFTRNLVTVLGEERIGFAAKRPEALVYGDFTTALAE